jgi:predicted nucleotidyltransferase
VLFEWLVSPIIYYKDDYFYAVITDIAKHYFSPISTIYHYLHMANGNYRQYLQTDEVKIKKYFYVLRPIMSCMWIEAHNEPPPMEFETLLTLIQDNGLLEEINKLLKRKKSGIEFGIEPRIPIINGFIEKALQHFKDTASTLKKKKKPNQQLLEDVFIKILDYVNYGLKAP